MKEKGQIENPAKWIETLIKDFINQSPENTLRNRGNEKAWEDPLVGFSNGDDPIYQQYKELVGTFHWTPLEIFSLTFPSSKVSAKDLTVISWILPQTEASKSDNRKETVYPSERWARAQCFRRVNVKLAKQVSRHYKSRFSCCLLSSPSSSDGI
jgi:hypothetical protein